MSIDALAQLRINKIPDSSKALLVHAMENVNTWLDFIHPADSVCWVAFPDPTSSRIENVVNAIHRQTTIIS